MQSGTFGDITHRQVEFITNIDNEISPSLPIVNISSPMPHTHTKEVRMEPSSRGGPIDPTMTKAEPSHPLVPKYLKPAKSYLVSVENFRKHADQLYGSSARLLW